MDTTALLFYACICAALSYASPTLGTPLRRVLVGAIVGIAAAALLPMLRTALAL